MGLIETVDNDLKLAMKAHDTSVVETLRMLRATMKNTQIEKQRPLTDEDVLGLLRTTLKQAADAKAQFVAGGRADLVEKTDAEMVILSRYLPPAMPAEELEKIVAAKVAEIGADPKAFGKVMGAVVKEVSGRADGAAIQAAVKKALGT